MQEGNKSLSMLKTCNLSIGCMETCLSGASTCLSDLSDSVRVICVFLMAKLASVFSYVLHCKYRAKSLWGQSKLVFEEVKKSTESKNETKKIH